MHFTYDGPDEQQAASVNRILDMIYEQRHFGYRGKDKVDIAWEYVSPELFAEFCNFFDDAISVNKVAAVIWLFEQGYSHERDVKGLSIELVKRILATHAAAIQDAQSAQPIRNTAKRPAKPAPAPIIVYRILWEGKEPAAVVGAMREEKYIDAVIPNATARHKGKDLRMGLIPHHCNKAMMFSTSFSQGGVIRFSAHL